MPDIVNEKKITNIIILVVFVLYLVTSVFQIINCDYSIEDYYEYKKVFEKFNSFEDDLKKKKIYKNISLFIKYFIIIINIISFLFVVLLSYEILTKKELLDINIVMNYLSLISFFNMLISLVIIFIISKYNKQTYKDQQNNQQTYKHQQTNNKHYNTQIMNNNFIIAGQVLSIIMVIFNILVLFNR